MTIQSEDVLLSNTTNNKIMSCVRKTLSGAVYSGLIRQKDYDNYCISEGGIVWTSFGSLDDNFRFSVSNAGDVNGDRFSDFIIGVEKYQSTSSAHIVYGSRENHRLTRVDFTDNSLPSSYGITILPAQESDRFGFDVSNAGDVNGDGFGDVMVSAPFAADNKGVTYIIYGAPHLSNIDLANPPVGYGIKIVGEEDSFGYSVSSAGDVNGDGFSDMIIAAPFADDFKGAAYIVYGSPNLSDIDLANTPAGSVTKISGKEPSGYLGISVSSAGDVNGDGFPDLVVGAYAENSYDGAAYIIYGSKNLKDIDLANPPAGYGIRIAGQKGLEHYGTDRRDGFGKTVTAAGDLNDDGFDDVFIGNFGSDSHLQEPLYVLYGSDNLTDTQVEAVGEAKEL